MDKNEVRKFLDSIKDEICSANALRSFRQIMYIYFSNGLNSYNGAFWHFLYIQIFEKEILSVAKICEKTKDIDDINLDRFFLKYGQKFEINNEKSLFDSLKESDKYSELINKYRNKYVGHLTELGVNKNFGIQMSIVEDILDEVIAIHKSVYLKLLGEEITHNYLQLEESRIEKMFQKFVEWISNERPELNQVRKKLESISKRSED
jgi:hypothetical protein